MKRSSIYSIFTLYLTFVAACSKVPISPEEITHSLPNSITDLYAIGFKSGHDASIYYMDLKSMETREIVSGLSFSDINVGAFCSQSKKELIVAASERKLYFIRTTDNVLLKEIEIPNTVNHEPNILYGKLALLPYPGDPNYCVLVNRSVYLIDMNNFKIERVIWDSYVHHWSTFVHAISLSPEEIYLYMQLYQFGLLSRQGDTMTFGWYQQIARLNLLTGEANVFYRYPDPNNDNGTKMVFSTSDHVVSYNTNTKQVIVFSAATLDSMDSYQILTAERPSDHISYSDHAVVQDVATGAFYKLDPKEKTLEAIMLLDIGFQSYGATYQEISGGDLYACVGPRHRAAVLIANVTQDRIELEFPKEEFWAIHLMEEKQ